MNKTIKKKWLKALRSGEYVQGRRQLVKETKDGDEFCCLGVLCDVMGVEFERRLGNMRIADTLYSGGLSPELCRVADLPHDAQTHLIRMNDGEFGKEETRSDFNEIADWIEANL